ncbi:MAG TPA: VOC family protein [Gemmatimonadales bacterium]|nr:VOC family protein [Gemmatimonadales bacterium]
MGATTRDIFGRADNAEPASPGTYGEAPRGFRLPDATRLGRIRLQVSDLDQSLDYYQGVLGLRTMERDATGATLGTGDSATPLVELRERRGARPALRRGSLGLYHFAILLPDRASLGRLLRHLGENGVRFGSADHLVSESLYLQDPDDLGIEVYADRPRSTWRRVGRELMMATDPIDIEGLLAAAGDASWKGMPAGTTIGHVHLHVGDLEQAAGFYSEALGFDRMVWHYPGALFFGAGGYHHHLGTNTWAGSDAKAPAEGAARLLEWSIVLPDASSALAAGESLAQNGYSPVLEKGSRSELVVRDPWGTELRLMTGNLP